MPAGEDLSLDELDSIMNLQRQEAFDEHTEALHQKLSRRGSLKGFKSPTAKESVEAQLSKVISGKAGKPKSSSRSRSRGMSRSKSSMEARAEKVRSRSSGRPEPPPRAGSRSGNLLRSSSLRSMNTSSYHSQGERSTADAKFEDQDLEKSARRERRKSRRPPGRTKSGDVSIDEKYRKGASANKVRSPLALTPSRSLSLDQSPVVNQEELPFIQIWEDDLGGLKTPPKKEKASKRSSGGSSGSSKKTFEALLRDLPRTRSKPEDPDAKSVGAGSVISGNDENTTKKTKLQKIHELQAKCDRYKKEWLETSRDKKQLRNEIQEGKNHILVLTKEIEAQSSETGILQRKLSEALQKLDELTTEQYKERNSYSITAKELAESRIEFARTLNETNILKQELEKMEMALQEKENRACDLEDYLRHSKNQVDELDSTLHFAEEEAVQLERKIQLLEEELTQYRAIASQDNDDGEQMRKVKEDMERRMFEDREERLRERHERLEERIREFERERQEFIDEDKERRAQFEERVREEVEKHRDQDLEASRRNEDTAVRLDEIESENKALQGRLKSEQLDSKVKLRQKDERIELLQKEVASLESKLAEVGSNPESSSTLKQEAELAKSQTAGLKDEIAELQQQNALLVDEIEDLKTGTSAFQTQIKALRQEVATKQKEADQWQRKSHEWEAKSGEWTDKAHLWKDKAERWEKICRETNHDTKQAESSGVDPQANFLQAALERKKSLHKAESSWVVFGGLLSSRGNPEDGAGNNDSEMQERLHQMEAENTTQAEFIKSLRSDMMKMHTDYKEKAYLAQVKIQEVNKERDEVMLKNTNLMKELELARKLGRLASDSSLEE